MAAQKRYGLYLAMKDNYDHLNDSFNDDLGLIRLFEGDRCINQEESVSVIVVDGEISEALKEQILDEVSQNIVKKIENLKDGEKLKIGYSSNPKVRKGNYKSDESDFQYKKPLLILIMTTIRNMAYDFEKRLIHRFTNKNSKYFKHHEKFMNKSEDSPGRPPQAKARKGFVYLAELEQASNKADPNDVLENTQASRVMRVSLSMKLEQIEDVVEVFENLRIT